MNRIEKFYNRFPQKEKERLTRSAYDSIESEITKKFLSKYLKPQSRIADVGGGPGHYTTWLLQNGHSTHLIDLSEGLLEVAKESIQQENLTQNLLGISKLDARNLSGIPTDSFDVTLLMGPLYHLIELSDRKTALSEVLRITKPGGLIFSAIINRLCPFINMMHKSPESLLSELEHDTDELNRIIDTGKYENFEELPNQFTDAYFAEIDDVPKLYKELNIEMIETFACEGIASYLYEKAEVIKKSSQGWDHFLNIIFKNATRPELLGASEHVVFIGRKVLT